MGLELLARGVIIIHYSLLGFARIDCWACCRKLDCWLDLMGSLVVITNLVTTTTALVSGRNLQHVIAIIEVWNCFIEGLVWFIVIVVVAVVG